MDDNKLDDLKRRAKALVGDDQVPHARVGNDELPPDDDQLVTSLDRGEDEPFEDDDAVDAFDVDREPKVSVPVHTRNTALPQFSVPQAPPVGPPGQVQFYNPLWDRLTDEEDIARSAIHARSARRLIADNGDLAEGEQPNANETDDSINLPPRLRRVLGEPTSELLDNYLSDVRDHLVKVNSQAVRKTLSLETNGEPSTLHKLLQREIGAIGVKAIAAQHAEICQVFAKSLKTMMADILAPYVVDQAAMDQAAKGLPAAGPASFVSEQQVRESADSSPAPVEASMRGKIRSSVRIRL